MFGVVKYFIKKGDTIGLRSKTTVAAIHANMNFRTMPEVSNMPNTVDAIKTRGVAGPDFSRKKAACPRKVTGKSSLTGLFSLKSE